MTAPELDLETAGLSAFTPREFARIVKGLSKKEFHGPTRHSLRGHTAR